MIELVVDLLDVNALIAGIDLNAVLARYLDRVLTDSGGWT